MTETPLFYGNTPESDFTSQLRRVFEAAECRTQIELAEFFGIRQSSVADAKRRHSIPSEWLIQLFEKKRINPDWIRMGLGDKRIQPLDDEAPAELAQGVVPPFIKVVERKPVAECGTDELLAELLRRALKSSGCSPGQMKSWFSAVCCGLRCPNRSKAPKKR